LVFVCLIFVCLIFVCTWYLFGICLFICGRFMYNQCTLYGILRLSEPKNRIIRLVDLVADLDCWYERGSFPHFTGNALHASA